MHLVVRAVGYRGVEVPGLPFDERACTIPNAAGRISGRARDYVTGWIKRGPSGVIGTNKSDSQETVDTLVADLAASPVREDAPSLDALAAWLSERSPQLVTNEHWQVLDAITHREGGRADAIMREHSRLAQRNLRDAMQAPGKHAVPGVRLIKQHA